MLSMSCNGVDVPLKVWKFPAGEIGIKIESDLILADKRVEIRLEWESNDDLIALTQLVDAVRSGGEPWRFILEIPYFPYSRQDRRCFRGEGHALKAVANIINSLKFDAVATMDAHSYVLEALIDHLYVYEQYTCAAGLPYYDYLIAPDDGASKKIFKHEQVSSSTTKVLTATKRRGEGGKIISTEIPNMAEMVGKNVCVVDDLCDGGATFIALADVILNSEYRPNLLDLYVTHGIFTKGVDELLRKYNNIYVANLMNKDEAVINNPRIIRI